MGLACTALGIPQVEKLEEFVSSTLFWLDKRVKRRRWSDSEIDEQFAKRSAEQVLAEGHTCYMNPCLDFTLVLHDTLRINGLDPVMAIRELSGGGYPFNRLHFGSEFVYEGEPYFLEFKTLNEVFLGRGKFFGLREGTKTVGTLRLASVITPDMNIFDVLGEPLPFRDFRLGLQLGRLKQDNTDKTYRRYLAALNGRGLYLDSDVGTQKGL